MPFFKRSQSHGTAFDPTFRFETSWILPPAVLAGIRALLSLYSFVTLFTIFGWNGTHNRSEESQQSFSYFTNLTYWGLSFYFAFSAVHSASYSLRGRPFLASWPRALQEAHSLLYTTIVVYPWIVTIVFWALLYSNFVSPFQTWTNTSQHALNSVYSLFEIVLPRTAPPPFLHIIGIVVILAMYLGLAYVTYETEHFFVYDFLDNRTNSPGRVAGYIVGILIGAVIVFLIIRYIIVLRVWLTEEKIRKKGKITHHGRATQLEDTEKNVIVEDATRTH